MKLGGAVEIGANGGICRHLCHRHNIELRSDWRLVFDRLGCLDGDSGCQCLRYRMS